MCAHAARLVAVALLVARVATADIIKIGVVEGDPEAALMLGAGVSAALEGVGVEEVAPVEPSEPLAAGRAVCALAAAGAAAVVAGGDERAARLAAHSAARAGVPLLAVGEAPLHAGAGWEVVGMFPHRALLATAARDLATDKGWQRAVLLHEASAEDAALLAPTPDPLRLLARQLPPLGEDTLLRDLLLVLKKIGEVKFIVWCGAEYAVRVLDMAQRVGLLSERHAYLVLALDLQTQPLAAYSHGGANITALRLYDPESEAARAMLEAWRTQYAARVGTPPPGEADAAPPPAALPLAYRAARLAAEALALLDLPPTSWPNCDTAHGAFHADTLLNYLRSEEWEGGESGGPISWDGSGSRQSVQLEGVEVGRGGVLRHVAVWAPGAGLVWQRSDPPAPPPPADSMTNRTFNILIAVNEPYVMRQQSTDRLSGNTRYEGFCIELIQRLGEILNFNYTFIEQKDGVYGNYNNRSGRWTGMLGRLIEDEDIHFAITDLTITAEREQAVDFTTPFMNLGISILFRKPGAPEPELFAFLLPFSSGVWLCLGLAYLGTSLLLYVVGRLCHEEWQNPYPCIEEPVALENQFTLGNALWFNLGAVLLQGSEIAPVAYGTRAVAGVWWLFALIITSSYTANLATLLAKKSTTEVIAGVEDLINEELNIDYGAKHEGSTYTFFEHSQSPVFKQMFEHMRKNKMPRSNEDGIKKVMNESMYAFLMESTTIEYNVERNCDIMKVGGLLDSKGYGIAMRKNSEYRQAMNLALLNLQEGGVLRQMKNSWWNEKHGGGACKDTDERASEELAMANFLGLFLVLAVGCALGVVVSCVDLALCAARRARLDGEPFGARLAAELRFVFRFEQSVKPVQGPLSESSSGSTRGEHEAEAEAEAEGEHEAEREAEGEGEAEAGRAGSVRSTGRRRRRSSMHAASLRLARHTTPSKHAR